MRRCKAKNKDRTPCRMRPLQNSAFCFNHDPDSRDHRAAARKQGGAQRKKQLLREPLQGEPEWWRFATLSDAKGALVWAVRNLVQGELDARTANALCGVVQGLSSLIRDVDLEARLSALELAAAKEESWTRR